MAVNDKDGTLRVVMFSPVGMEGSGRILTVKVESLTVVTPVAPFVIDAQANEGAIRLRTRTFERDEPRQRNLKPSQYWSLQRGSGSR
jgi:hypothetical protein